MNKGQNIALLEKGNNSIAIVAKPEKTSHIDLHFDDKKQRNGVLNQVSPYIDDVQLIRIKLFLINLLINSSISILGKCFNIEIKQPIYSPLFLCLKNKLSRLK